MSYTKSTKSTKSTPSLDNLEPGLYYRNLPLMTEPLHKSAKSLMAVYEKDEYGEWSTYRGRGIPDCDAEDVALHHLAEYHERGGLFRLSFSATPTNGAGSMTTYEPGQKTIAALREEPFPTPVRAKVGDIIEITNPGNDDDPAVKGCRFTVSHVTDGSGFVTVRERFLGFNLGEFEVVG